MESRRYANGFSESAEVLLRDADGCGYWTPVPEVRKGDMVMAVSISNKKLVWDKVINEAGKPIWETRGTKAVRFEGKSPVILTSEHFVVKIKDDELSVNTDNESRFIVPKVILGNREISTTEGTEVSLKHFNSCWDMYPIALKSKSFLIVRVGDNIIVVSESLWPEYITK